MCFEFLCFQSGPDSVFRPGNKVLSGQAGKPLMAAFAHFGQLGCKGMKISPVGSRLSVSRFVLRERGVQIFIKV